MMPYSAKLTEIFILKLYKNNTQLANLFDELFKVANLEDPELNVEVSMCPKDPQGCQEL